MAQENEHIQTLVAARNRELERRRDVAKALAEAIDRARADEESLASVILVLHSQGGSLRVTAATNFYGSR